MITVLIVEDSKVVLDYLVYIVEKDPQMSVLGTADSGESAMQFLAEQRPDVILMDVFLPGIDGFETTRRIMTSVPVPIVICTGSTSLGETQFAMRALEAGALTVLRKPKGFGAPGSDAEAALLVETLRLMSEVKLVRRWNGASSSGASALSRTDIPAHPEGPSGGPTVVAIGASTGGPPAILTILTGLPKDFPLPILLVQHISSGLTVGFADWLASESGMPVSVAVGGELPQPGRVYVAPDDRHMLIGSGGELRTSASKAYYGLRPSVGVLFQSVAEHYGNRAIGILLTGMGRDGADELRVLADVGALTIAQDEKTSVVFGMPGEAIRLGAARFVLPPERIAELLVSRTQGR